MSSLGPADIAAAATIRKHLGRYDTDWIFDPRRCKASLGDLLVNVYGEEHGDGTEGRLVINILAAAATCGVPGDLVRHRDGQSPLPLEALFRKWERCLCRTEGKSPELAVRAIALWAAVFAVELPPHPREPSPPRLVATEDAWVDAAPPVPQPQAHQPALPSPPQQLPAMWRWLLGGVAVMLLVAAATLATTDAGKDARVWLSSLIKVDPPQPRATALGVDAERTYGVGDEVELTTSFSRPVAVTGTPRIHFRIAGDPTPRFARFQTGDGSPVLTFAWEVARGIEGMGIDVGASPTIELAGGTIVDAATRVAAGLDLREAVPENLADVRIDSQPPRVRTVDLPPPRGYRVGDTLEFAVEFTEPVLLTGSPSLELRLGEAVRQTDVGVHPDGKRLTFRYTVQPEDATSAGVTATRLLLESARIADRAGNEAETAFAAARSDGVRIVLPAAADWIEVVLPRGRLRLRLVAAGRQEIPAEMLQEWQPYAKAYRRPTTLVIDRPFYIGEAEVSREEFLDVVGRPPAVGAAPGVVLPPSDDPQWQRPATDVPWSDAIRFCNILSEREGLRPCYLVEPAAGGSTEPRVTQLKDGNGFRLPLPDEWVYACLTNRDLRGMTSGVSEWSDLEPGATFPFAHGGHDGGPKQGPTFLLRPDRPESPQDCGFRLVRSAGQTGAPPRP